MREFFPNVPKIQYEGADSNNNFSFRFYNPEEVVGEKTMREQLRFAMAYWHTLCATGQDPFGVGTAVRPYGQEADVMETARNKAYAGFELLDKLGLDFFCFHDRDIAPEADTLAKTNERLDEITALLKELMKQYDKKLLWGTAALSGHPRYVHGAATSPNAEVFAYAASAVKKAMEITKELGGEGYVFWGGREGYETLLNTDMALELDNMGRFFNMAAQYKEKIGFEGDMYIEPKPKEPTKHQYDFDSAAVFAFLQKYGLIGKYKLNIEANHATLAMHTFQHELRYAAANGLFGSIDANRGDPNLGWDTDQFAADVYDTTLCMYEVLRVGGFTRGGLNFDAKVRRASFTPEDLFYAHISSMDAFALGLKAAHSLYKSGDLEQFISERYASYGSGIGKDIVDGKVGFEELEAYSLSHTIENVSGRQEMLESILNKHIFAAR